MSSACKAEVKGLEEAQKIVDKNGQEFAGRPILIQFYASKETEAPTTNTKQRGAANSRNKGAKAEFVPPPVPVTSSLSPFSYLPFSWYSWSDEVKHYFRC